MSQLVTDGAIEGLGYSGIRNDIDPLLAVACHFATRSPDSLMTARYLEMGAMLRAVDARYAGRNHGEEGE